MYVGCVAHKGAPLQPITGAMTFDEAYFWAVSSDRMMEHGKKRSWGLYTPNRIDACAMAYALGNFLPPELHSCQSAIIPLLGHEHYHVSGMDFQGYFKHFHLWYGVPIS